MPYLVIGSDRQTSREVQFLSNASNEVLARKSGDALGIHVTSVTSVPEFAEPQDLPALFPPTVKWSGDWKTATPASDPTKRRQGFSCAIIGLIIFGFAVTSLCTTKILREGAAAAKMVILEKRNGVWVRAEPFMKGRTHVGVLAGLIGGGLVLYGMRLYRAHPPADDEPQIY